MLCFLYVTNCRLTNGVCGQMLHKNGLTLDFKKSHRKIEIGVI